MKRLLILISIVTFSGAGHAQDVHFTMFHAAPTVLNPGAAGLFNGTFRASTNFKTQWGSISNPYQTYSFTADGNFFQNRGGTAYLGAAIAAYRDVAGTTKFGTTKINASLSGIINMDANNLVAVGLTGGWAQRSFSPGDLQWDEQFNGQSFDPNLPSNETYGFNSSTFIDFATGVMWQYGTSASTITSFDKFHAQAGIAYHHLARPKFDTYYGNTDKLYGKFVIHGDMHFSASSYSKWAYRPRFSAFFQGPSREVNLGLMCRYLISEGSKYTGFNKGLAISAGGYYRVGDAISPSVELEIAGFTIGYSYDFTLSALRMANSGLGGSEFFIKFQNPNPFFKFSRTPSIR